MLSISHGTVLLQPWIIILRIVKVSITVRIPLLWCRYGFCCVIDSFVGRNGVIRRPKNVVSTINQYELFRFLNESLSSLCLRRDNLFRSCNHANLPISCCGHVNIRQETSASILHHVFTTVGHLTWSSTIIIDTRAICLTRLRCVWGCSESRLIIYIGRCTVLGLMQNVQ
jgi:hypothetical protein